MSEFYYDSPFDMGMMGLTDLVLITGATGHVGFATLLYALRSGCNVRAAVRSRAKATFLLSHPLIQSLNCGPQLTTIVVPDITAPGAYDAAVENVTHVIHIASPLVTGDRVPLELQEEYFIPPAVNGTLGMLESADRCGTVRRVVITSSIVAVVPVAQMEGGQRRCNPVQPTDRVNRVAGPPFESEFAAYAASKMAALAAAEAWVDSQRPAFDVVHLHPGFVLGRNDIATTSSEAMKGTNAMVLAMLLGKQFGPYAGSTVHIDDVARVHVQALDPTVPGNMSYLLSQPARWNDAKEIVRRNFPEAMESRMLVGTGSVGTTEIPIDASLTEWTFGFRHMGFEEQVTSIVGHFLELRQKRKPKSTKTQNSAPAPTVHRVKVKGKDVPKRVKASA